MGNQKGSATLVGIIVIVVVLIAAVGGAIYLGVVPTSFLPAATPQSANVDKTGTPLPMPSGLNQSPETTTQQRSAPQPATQSSPTPAPTVSDYDNPFDASSYQNPFEDTANPFENL